MKTPLPHFHLTSAPLFLLLLPLITSILCDEGVGGGYFNSNGDGRNLFFTSSFDYNGNGGGGGGSGGGSEDAHLVGQPVNAAIATRRTFEIKPIMMANDPVTANIVDVSPSEQPVQVIFRTQSSPVMVQQVHTPGQPGQMEKTSSEDEPHRVVHQVVRPIIQEVVEIIQPYRKVTQEVRPVMEQVQTLVAKDGGARKEYQYEHGHAHQRPPVYYDQPIHSSSSSSSRGLDDFGALSSPYGQMGAGSELNHQRLVYGHPGSALPFVPRRTLANLSRRQPYRSGNRFRASGMMKRYGRGMM